MCRMATEDRSNLRQENHALNETQTFKRLFFALWPDEKIRENCAAVSARLKKAGRQVHPDNLHVTLIFLGSIDAQTEAKIVDAASLIRFENVSITFDTLDYWRRPRIICLSGKPEGPSLRHLVENLNTIAAGLNIPTDDRPYQAHVTLLRKANKLPPLNFEPIAWEAGSFCLVESCSTPEGVVYNILKTWHADQTQEPVDPDISSEADTLPLEPTRHTDD